MTVKIVVDMNRSPEWVPVSASRGYDAVHWSAIGNPRAPDTEMVDWARTQGFVVFTLDSDGPQAGRRSARSR